MKKEDRLKELERQHKERLEKYPLEERKNAFDNLYGCFADLKDVDLNELKKEKFKEIIIKITNYNHGFINCIH